MGTANLMGKHLGIRWRATHLVDQLQRAIEHGKVVHLDCATANGELFLLVAGVGLDGKVVHELTRLRKGPITYLSYARPLLSALAGYHFPPISVTVDGKRVFGPAPGVAFIGNIKEYGTGFPVLSRADPTDQKLDTCVLPCRNTLELLEHGMWATVGEHMRSEGVVYTLGQHIEITSPQSVPVQIDGEAAGHTPLTIDLLPVRLPFIVPA
jgi:diacylglycerol kinase family enzyme